MKTKQWVGLVLTVAFLLGGCAAIKRDQWYSDWGYDELQKGNYGKAERYLKQALTINPDNPYALLNLGVVYENTGRTEQARERYERVLTLRQEDQQIIPMRTSKDEAKGRSIGTIAKENLDRL